MSTLKQVTIGRSTVEAVELGQDLVVLSTRIHNARLITSNGWGKIVGTRDAAGNVRTSFGLVASFNPKFGDIVRAKLSAKPFRTGATLDLVLVMTEEKTGTRESGDKEYAQFDWVARVVDFAIVADGEGEVVKFDAFVKKDKSNAAKPESKTPAVGTFSADLS